jgi:hypothetical protein
MNVYVGVFEGIDGGDVGMIEGGENLGFALEAGEALRVGGHGLRENLDSDLAAELRVLRTVDLTHTTFTQLGEDSEMRKSHAI